MEIIQGNKRNVVRQTWIGWRSYDCTGLCLGQQTSVHFCQKNVAGSSLQMLRALVAQAKRRYSEVFRQM